MMLKSVTLPAWLLNDSEIAALHARCADVAATMAAESDVSDALAARDTLASLDAERNGLVYRLQTWVD